MFLCGIDMAMLVFDGVLANLFVGIVKTLTIIGSDIILFAEASQCGHTDPFSLECDGLAIDDELFSIEVGHGGIFDCFSNCNLCQCLWICRGAYFFCYRILDTYFFCYRIPMATWEYNGRSNRWSCGAIIAILMQIFVFSCCSCFC